MKVGARTVTYSVAPDRRVGNLPLCQFRQFLRNVAGRPLRSAGDPREAFHRAPDVHTAQRAHAFLYQGIGREVEEIPRTESWQLACHRLEDAAEGVEESGFPDEVNWVDTVLLPPFNVLLRSLQPLRLANEPAMCPHNNTQWLGGRLLRS